MLWLVDYKEHQYFCFSKRAWLYRPLTRPPMTLYSADSVSPLALSGLIQNRATWTLKESTAELVKGKLMMIFI